MCVWTRHLPRATAVRFHGVSGALSFFCGGREDAQGPRARASYRLAMFFSKFEPTRLSHGPTANLIKRITS